MSDLVKELGLEEDKVQWYHLAACKNTDINWFYDNYETDPELAKQIDQMCLHCPVVKQCYENGVQGKEKGVWGGVYMDLGRTDHDYNKHKTPEDWKALKKLHGKNIL
jgi:hypothetical protein